VRPETWLPLVISVGILVAGIGYAIGAYKKGRNEAASTAIAAQQAQIQVQDQTIASLRYELSAVREEMTITATKCTGRITELEGKVLILETELKTTTDLNLQLNQMPPKEVLQALGADAAMRITEFMGERLHMLEQGMARLLAEPSVRAVKPSTTKGTA
jgi:hypothetical protein